MDFRFGPIVAPLAIFPMLAAALPALAAEVYDSKDFPLEDISPSDPVRSSICPKAFTLSSVKSDESATPERITFFVDASAVWDSSTEIQVEDIMVIMQPQAPDLYLTLKLQPKFQDKCVGNGRIAGFGVPSAQHRINIDQFSFQYLLAINPNDGYQFDVPASRAATKDNGSPTVVLVKTR